ncbi:SWIRM domain-containing protein laf1 [Sphaceloma murrayae]|uniref:SWIRM domain-containing protein laf1 n=1 Tax=Sphaceloma murrayae TaxID=2082308 RepID=A0A2K1QHD0_9PEZI|nr:SWIRM domain-containing protein laf1 [Sphaceloma murrayae]
MQSDVRHDKTPSVGVFFSPPEAPKHDSFTSTQSPLRQSLAIEHKAEPATKLPSLRSILSPLSPPVSPATKPEQELGTHDISHNVINDPPLFPLRSERTPSDSAQPLFRSDFTPSIEQHISVLDARGIKGPRPTIEEYAIFTASVIPRYNANPQAYIRKELDFLKMYPPRWVLADPSRGTKRKADVDTRSNKRSRPAPKAATEKLPPIKRTARTSPRDVALDTFDPSPAPKHKRKVSRATPTPREDMDFRKIPDYSPPISSILPGKNLKIDWKGHPLDLSDDSDRHLLDDAEVALASVLRLTAAQYLFAKRRIFEKFVDLARVGKDLNKTSAQAVCKIDVNKASKLWTAFEKVGWFERGLFARYLE